MDFFRQLQDLGLVRVRLTGPTGVLPTGTVWWIGRERAKELVQLGEAELLEGQCTEQT